jgi:hypothetical protein
MVCYRTVDREQVDAIPPRQAGSYNKKGGDRSPPKKLMADR